MEYDFYIYAAALSKLFAYKPAVALQLIERVGEIGEIFKLGKEELGEMLPFDKEILEALTDPALLEWAQKEIDWARSNGVQTLYITDQRYPYRLRECYDAPILLYYKGNADLNARRVISVVGTRKASYYGKSSCRKVIEELASSGKPLVISGLAYGIDAAAHRAAMEYGLPTVGVMATGIDTIYPPQHRDLAEVMLEKGGLLTDFYRGCEGIKVNFIKRNRIIAGMADAVLLGESYSKGGGLITTSLASSYSREVYAIPGRIGDDSFEGCNNLIERESARIVTNPGTISASMGWRERKLRAKASAPDLFDGISSNNARAILITLKERDSLTAEQIEERTGIPLRDLSTELLQLEISGKIVQIMGDRYSIA
jgi:DNA processing protein